MSHVSHSSIVHRHYCVCVVHTFVLVSRIHVVSLCDGIACARSLILKTLLERRGGDGVQGVIMMVAEDNSFEPSKKVSLRWFGLKICQHFKCGAMANVYALRLDTIL